ncbi:MAG: flagellar hook-length control protein FliK [Desulfuromusa sp.]
MDALSMIDTGKNPLDVVAPVKSMDKNGEQFGKVLHEKQQTQQQHESEPVVKHPETAAGSMEKQVVAHNHKTEMKQETPEQKESLKETVTESSPQLEVVPQLQDTVQHTLVDLMKTIVPSEAVEDAEVSDSLETLLADLVQQLETTELHGEQVLAGIDLSTLVTELQSLGEESDKQELLAQLATQVEAQLTDKSNLLGNAEWVAAMAVDAPRQNVVPVVAENLAPARQILQKAFDAVISQKAVEVETAVVEESVAGVEPQVEEIIVAMEKMTEEIDPRFAGLLKPRKDQQPMQSLSSAKEPAPLHHSRQQTEMKQGETVVPVPATEMQGQSQKIATAQLSGEAAKRGLENLGQQPLHNLQPQAQGLEINKALAPTPVVQLTSGQQVTDSQIFDQVVTQISGSVNGESGRMVLRLHPAELGSLKLEVVVEGDRIRANLHAQSHQVQEVLERNLPQLRNALAEQGLKIDQFQVNIDQRQQSGQFENLAQQQQHNGSEKQPGWHQQDLEPEEQIIPLAHLMQNGGGGISLHV